ncbi:MAG: ABC transporter substrate-binding protein [Firmicutes bacterium HGW-Firmicutes-14]|jgi:NitT/TauT family transport system substrate-binding protein|nr:MAG: ABC transporter substrate-binding protein [Firmicutes bacterium HGW-Firmicutes-14]
MPAKKNLFGRKTFALLLIFMIFITTGCSGGKSGKTTAGTGEMAVKIAVINGPTGLSMIKMIEETPSFGEGIKSEYILKENPELVRPLLLQHEADIATVPTNLASILYNKKTGYRVAAVSLWGTLYLVGNDSRIKEWKDLKGRDIYLMAKGMTPDISFRYMLRQNGIDPEKDTRLNYTFPMPADLANAAAAGRADLAVLSEPMVSALLAQNRDVKIIMDLNKEWNSLTGVPMPQTSVIVRTDFTDSYPDVVEAFLREYRNSVQWVNANHVKAGELAVKHGIMPHAQVASEAVPRSNIRYEDAADARECIEDYLRILYGFNPDIIGGALPDEDFYYER